MDTMLEKAQLFFRLLLTKVISKLASMGDHIRISIAFTLSPRNYLSGKFCLIGIF